MAEPIDGLTLHGGVRYDIFYNDDYGMPCSKKQASGYTLVEVDANGTPIWEGYGIVESFVGEESIGPITAEIIRIYGRDELEKSF